MDTKLRSSHKFGITVVVLLLVFCSAIMISRYPEMKTLVNDYESPESNYENVLDSMGTDLMEGNYILYNEYSQETALPVVYDEYGQRQFDLIRKYLEYGLFDKENVSVYDNVSDNEADKLIDQNSKSEYYAFRAQVVFDESGLVSDVHVDGNVLDPQSEYALESRYVTELESLTDGWEIASIATPRDVTAVFAMTEDQLKSYTSTIYTGKDIFWLGDSELYADTFWAIVVFISASALLLPVFRRLDISECRCFRIPFEVAAVILIFGSALLYYLPINIVYLTIDEKLLPGMGHGMEIAAWLVNFLMWFIIFGVIFITITSLRAILRMKGRYWKERTLTAKFIMYMRRDDGRNGKKIKNEAGRICRKIREFFLRQYSSLQHIDFRNKLSRKILKIVIINYIVLAVVCLFWWYGAFALLIYSVLLFFFLRKYVRDIQEKYCRLLEETSRLAEGHLDIPIEGDVGIFNPIQDELKRIRLGFKKAVDEEVKNERMKTELVTNVSHDLRTPLTAIITYTDLLKNEKDEEKRKEYTDILERKSLRLKVLIEDLFEISKAASKNVTMNYMQVDVVDLLKQVGLENEDKIKNAQLEFRWSLPDRKILMWLDSQKTYRIFENLIINITKYAMPLTRAYIEMTEQADSVSITMKNVSADELNFNTEEITDRFVRGDSSRNTEGSGLGLAIAKSFVELQQGSLKISTDADLFKVEIIFKKQDHSSEKTAD